MPKRRIRVRSPSPNKEMIVYDPGAPIPADFRNPNERRRGVIEKLTHQNSLMLDHYFNKAKYDKFKAYIMAGYTGRGTSGRVSCFQLFRKTAVRREIARRQALMLERSEMGANDVLKELCLLILSDKRGIFKRDGSLKGMNELTAEQARMIKGVDSIELGKRGTVQKVKFVDPLRALELYMRGTGMFEKDKTDEGRGDLFINVTVDKE